MGTSPSTAWVAALLAEYYLMIAFAAVCLIVAIVSLVRCLPKNAQRFEMSFRRTKGFWLGMTGGATALGAVGLLSNLGNGPFGLIFPVIGACMAMVYLTDVDPAVSE